jgi:hypothetical protein
VYARANSSQQTGTAMMPKYWNCETTMRCGVDDSNACRPLVPAQSAIAICSQPSHRWPGTERRANAVNATQRASVIAPNSTNTWAADAMGALE